MFYKTLFFMLLGLLVLPGCSRSGEESAEPAASARDNVHSESWRESQVLAGRAVYETACASCHSEGEGGAPVLGDREDWSQRSDLWSAVLSGHARAGYLNMPEKGGHGELTDEQVAAAVEYMMLTTFPEKPRD
jgi:cytochrome c5